jgi:hypothetical protein
MSFGTFAFVWPVISISLVVGATLLMIWLQDRAKRQKTHRVAGTP